jgi:glycosyltransferase involved in cell wall biosynthesis
LNSLENKEQNQLSYALITPARNEQENIERLIKCMIAQTILPAKWVIVSDGSTDSTDAIVRKYLDSNAWIELVRMPEHRERHFAAKVNCFNAGYQKVKNSSIDIIGNLDADISFESDYFEFLLSKFLEEEDLGVAGTPFVEDGEHYNYKFTNIEHVSGACQLFRAQCFEEIGGYQPIQFGGIDWVAVTTARMKGWKTRTYTSKTCFHHRKMGTGSVSALKTWFKQGQKDFLFGNHPLWEIFRASYQMGKRPKIIGGTLIIIGYLWARLIGKKMLISNELRNFIRREQINRLKTALKLSPSS